MKQTLCLLLALLMIGLTGCGGASAPAIEADAEIEHALSYGIVPEEIQGDYGRQITFRQFTLLLGNVIARWDEALVPQWEEITAAAARSDEKMHREDGLLEMAYALELVGHIQPDQTADMGSVDPMVEAAIADQAQENFSWEYPLFPTWEKIAFPFFESNYMMGGLFMGGSHTSWVSGKPIFPYEPEGDENYMQSPLTRADAIRAALRFGETDPFVFAEEGEYYHVSEVGSYDRTIITDELLNAPTDLPEVTQDKFPSEWKGAGITTSKHFSGESYTYYREYQESDFIFLSENGFNFSCILLSFSTFRFPEVDGDPRMINGKELKDLDQLIAWGIEHGVHIQLVANFYLDENGRDMYDDIGNSNNMPTSDEEWALFRDYWTMLARRYKGIPNRYLTFQLINEIHPGAGEDFQRTEGIEAPLAGMTGVVEAIRKEDSERVLLHSYYNNANMEWVEAMAQLGLGIGAHPYMPAYQTLVHWTYAEENPYADGTWPQIWWPSGQIGKGKAPLALEGAVGGLTVSVHVAIDAADGKLVAYGDGKEITSVEISHPQPEDLFTFTVPDDTKKVEIWVRGTNVWIQIDTLLLEGDFGRKTIIPHDLCDVGDPAAPLPLVIHEDGSYTNTEDRWIDGQEIYDYKIAPLAAITEKHNVGFVCNEIGMLPVEMYWDVDMTVAFHDELFAMLEEKQIPWSFYTLYDTVPNSIGLMFGRDPYWQGATVSELTYGDTTYRVCQELLDVFRKYTLN